MIFGRSKMFTCGILVLVYRTVQEEKMLCDCIGPIMVHLTYLK